MAPFRSLDRVRQRFGLRCAAQHAAHRLVNSVAFAEVLHVVVLERDELRPPPDIGRTVTHRLATRDDLERMRRDPRLDVDDVKMAHFQAGNCCLLSFVDGELAGYTWADTAGRPELLPGLVVSVPRAYVYGYAALTLPEYRGVGLQSHRGFALLNEARWRWRDGLLGVVRHTNWSSRRGQSRSGYRRIGSISLLGTPARFTAVFSQSLRELGFARMSR